MSRVLYIKASPRGAASKSAMIADAYLAALQATDPATTIDVLDLATERLPDFDGDKVAAKMSVITKQPHDGPQKTAWDEILAIAQRYTAADRYVFAVPMWNGGIPYKLKQYIDLIHQPGVLFKLDPAQGYLGLMQGKQAVLAMTSGAFSPARQSSAFGTDFHSTYLKAWLNQTGVEDIVELRCQPTLLTPDPTGDLERALSAAAQAGQRG